jgi:arsenate reductase-like glutaredoxin family protein
MGTSVRYGVWQARAWLDGHGERYKFHDDKTAGIERSKYVRLLA